MNDREYQRLLRRASDMRERSGAPRGFWLKQMINRGSQANGEGGAA